MSACPRPDSSTKELVAANPGSYTGNPPASRDFSCNVVDQDVEKQGSGSTTTVITTPGGGVIPCVLGFKWEGEWSPGIEYKKQVCFTNPNGSVVEYEGSSWLCIQDHTSTSADAPTTLNPTPPAINGSSFWEPMSKGSTTVDQEQLQADAEKSWWDKITDWVKDMDIWDWLKVAAIAGGLIYYGTQVLGSMDEDGEGDGNADKRYNGSAGYNGSYTKPTLRDVLFKLCAYGNITCDVSGIPVDEVVEFTLANTTSVRTILQQLSIAFNFDMVNSGGILKFVTRSGNPSGTISLSDMGYSSNVNPPAPYTSKRFQGISLPRKVTITYFSPSLDMNNYTQTAELFTYPEGNELNIQVPITLTDQQARKIAELNLINSHLERMNYKFTGTYKLVKYEPGDIVNSPMGIIRITKINETDAGLLAFEACDAGEPSASALSDLDYTIPTNTENDDFSIGYSQSFFIDPPWLGPGDTGTRLYAVVHGYGKAGWPGAMIYMSRDNINFNALMTVNQETTWGKSNAILGAPVIVTSGVDEGWDITNTLSITLKTGQLVSATDVEVLAGTNWIFVGQELIGFGTATLTGPNTYTISRLRRGLQGTDNFGPLHQADELVSVMSTLAKVELLESDIGKQVYFKTVTLGSGLDVADLDTVTVTSNNNKLWAPTNGVATRQADNSWLITWKENIRIADIVNNNASTMTPVDSDQSGWGVAILDSSGVVKSTRPCGYSNYTYTVAEQNTDFGSLQTHIKVSVVPMSKKYGGGYPLIING